MAECKIVYTPWENLKKTSDMVVGQVGYHNSKRVKYITVKKNSDIVKKIEKTRSPDKTPDLQAERQGTFSKNVITVGYQKFDFLAVRSIVGSQPTLSPVLLKQGIENSDFCLKIGNNKTLNFWYRTVIVRSLHIEKLL